MVLIGTNNTPTVVLSFYADYKSGRVRLDKDAIEYTWVSEKEARKYDFIEGIYEEIQMADKIIKGANPNKVKFIPKKY